MSEPFLINLKEAFLNAPGFWESSLSEKSGNWCKRVEGIDKTQTDGYSIIGDFVSQWNLQTFQQPGLYLSCEKKGSKKGAQKRLYALFLLQPNGEVQILKEYRSASKDWAVELWPDIEAHLAIQTDSVQQRRSQLLSEIETLEFELSQRRAELAALEIEMDRD
jgi:hypothetical protein